MVERFLEIFFYIDENAVNKGDGDEMTRGSRTVVAIKAQISKFSGIISKEITKPKLRLVKEMLYGIQASKDIKIKYSQES